MKITIFKRGISLLLCLMFATTVMMTASARYADDFDGSYEDLNCSEDDCDCLEPDNNRFKVVSPSSLTNSHDTVIFTGAYHEVLNYFNELGQTDGMPIVPPTKLKVEKFMRYTPYDDNDVVATLNGRQVTAYQVAVNAVMAGCFAEFMPVCIALVEAMGSEGYLDSVADGTLIPMAIVNGPIARQIGIDNTQGMTTEEVNIELARFIEFALNNLAGITANRSNSFGSIQPLVYSENDQACLNIGWEPYHVQQGYELNDSTVTLTSFSMWGNNVTPATDLADEIMKVIAWDITEKNLGALGSTDTETYANTKRTVLITPQVAVALSSLYKSKEALETDLVKTARRPMWMRTFAYYYANTAGVLTGRKSFTEVYYELVAEEEEDAKLTSSPAWMSGITNPQIETGAVMKMGNTRFLVTGDDSRNKTQVMPGGDGATVEVEFPEEWDSLMTSMTYKALAYYNLTGAQEQTITPPAEVPSVLTDGTYRVMDAASGANYMTAAGRMYYDSASHILYYYAYGASAKDQITLDPAEDEAFLAFIDGLGYNSSITISNQIITDAVIRFPSNAKKPSINASVLTAASFENVGLTLHASKNQSAAAGGVAQNGGTVTMSSSITSFDLNLDGTLVMGDSTVDGYVTLNGSTVTFNPYAGAGATAIIGTANTDGSYRTVTIVLRNGIYDMTYNTAGTLSVSSSAVYLNITGGEQVAFEKTDVQGVYALKKHFAAGQYGFKVTVGSTNYGGASFTNFCDRLLLTSSGADCTMTLTEENDYTFKFDSTSLKLTVVKDISGTVLEPTVAPSVVPSVGPNLALNGTIIVDSVNETYGGEGYLANDGDQETRWQSNSKGNGGEEAWIGCTWSTPQNVRNIVIYWELAHPSTGGFRVEISDNGTDWLPVPFATSRDTSNGDDYHVDTISLAETVTTKYIRVVCFNAFVNGLGAKENPSAYEFEVYGTSEGATLRGDTDGNGVVNAADLTALARHIGNIEAILERVLLLNADVDSDSAIGAADLTALARIVGRIG